MVTLTPDTSTTSTSSTPGVEPVAPIATIASGPLDYARAVQAPGSLVRLGDGNEWLIPHARVVPMGMPVPSSLAACGGVLRGETLDRFLDYSLAAAAIQAATKGVTVERLARFAADAIAVNYRLGWNEITAMGLLESTMLVEVFHAACDLGLLRDKKLFDARRDELRRLSTLDGYLPTIAEAAVFAAWRAQQG